MRLIKSYVLCFTVFCFNSCAEEVSRMGCHWKLPDRLFKSSENLWASQFNEDELFAYVHFENDFFNEKHIEISFEKTDLQRKIYATVTDNGYELVVYRDYLKSNKKISFPSIFVIKNLSGKGVFYLNDLDHEEVVGMVKKCMPNFH